MITAATVKKARKKSQVTGNVGLYYVAYRLSLLGWNVMPTARNAKGVDLIAYDTEAVRFKAIQVKALSKRNPVPLGANLSNVQADFWVIVTGVERAPDSKPDAFVLTPPT